MTVERFPQTDEIERHNALARIISVVPTVVWILNIMADCRIQLLWGLTDVSPNVWLYVHHVRILFGQLIDFDLPGAGQYPQTTPLRSTEAHAPNVRWIRAVVVDGIL